MLVRLKGRRRRRRGRSDVLIGAVLLLMLSWSGVVVVDRVSALGGFSEANLVMSAVSQASAVFGADMDGDGDVDILSASYSGDKIAIQENVEGNGSVWEQHIVDSDINAPQDLWAVDFDKDGQDLDFVASAQVGDQILWYECTNSLAFEYKKHVIDAVVDKPRETVVLDFDYDGHFDVLATAEKDDQVIVYLNNGTQGFSKIIVVQHQVDGADFEQPMGVRAGDLDQDGRQDVVAAALVSDKFSIFRNLNGTHFEEYVLDENQNEAHSVLVIDVDADGWLDIVAMARVEDTIAWYKNHLGDVSKGMNISGFQRHFIDTSLNGGRGLWAADINRDGAIDLAVALETADDVLWFANNGTGGFNRTEVDIASTGVRDVHVVDIDGDNKLDLVTAVKGRNRVNWYRNRLLAPSQAPTSAPFDAASVNPSQSPSTSASAAPSSQNSQETVTPTVQPRANRTPAPTTRQPTATPTLDPSHSPSLLPTDYPTTSPTWSPSQSPSMTPSQTPSRSPSQSPSTSPSTTPTMAPVTPYPSRAPVTQHPTRAPTLGPSAQPTQSPQPSTTPTKHPTQQPSLAPTTTQPTPVPTTLTPSEQPSGSPTWHPTAVPSTRPTAMPTWTPSASPSHFPSLSPSQSPSSSPTTSPTAVPTATPTKSPTAFPSNLPSASPTRSPHPSSLPTKVPSRNPTTTPSILPSASPTMFPQPSSAPSVGRTLAPSTAPLAQPSLQPTEPVTPPPSPAPTVLPTGVDHQTRAPTPVPSTAPSLGSFAAEASYNTVLSTLDARGSNTLSYAQLFGASAFHEGSCDAWQDFLQGDLWIVQNNQFDVLELWEHTGVSQPSVAHFTCTNATVNQQVVTALTDENDLSMYCNDTHILVCGDSTSPPSMYVCANCTDQYTRKELRGGSATELCTIADAHAPGAFYINPCDATDAEEDDNTYAAATTLPYSFAALATRYTRIPQAPTLSHMEVAKVGNASVHMSMNVSKEGLVYCAAFDNGTIPSTTGEIINTGASQLVSGSGRVTIAITDLVALTAYDVFCASESSDGEVLPLTSVLELGAFPVTTECCRRVTLLSGPSILTAGHDGSSGVEEGDLFVVSLDTSPDETVTFNVQLWVLPFATTTAGGSRSALCPLSVLTNSSANATVQSNTSVLATPAEITFAAGGTSLEAEVLITASADLADLCLFVLIGGDVVDTSVFTGAAASSSATEYVFLSELHAQHAGVLILDSQAEPPPVELSSAVFSNLGNELLLTLSGDSDRGASVLGAAGKFPCANVTDFPGVSSSQCRWLIDTKLVATIASNSETLVDIGDTVTLLADVLKPACTVTNTSLCSSWSYAAASTSTVQPPAAPVSPEVVLTAASSIAGCSDLAMDATGSSGSAGREWAAVTWEISSEAENVSLVQTYAEDTFTADALSDVLLIENALLESGFDYTFALTLENFLGGSHSAAITVAVDASDELPEVSITGSSSRTMLRPDSLSLFASGAVSTCSGTSSSSSSSLSLEYDWRVFDAETLEAVENVTSASPDPREMYIPAYSALQPGMTYTFSCVVTSATGNRNSDQVNVFVEESDLVAIIAGGSRRSTEAGASLELDASVSYDPDLEDVSGVDAGLVFDWSCTQISPSFGDDCGDSMVTLLESTADDTEELDIPAQTLPANTTLEVSVEVSSESSDGSMRTALQWVVLVVTASAAPEVTVSKPDGKVNPSRKLTVQASIDFDEVDDAEDAVVSVSWSLTDGEFVSGALLDNTLTPVTDYLGNGSTLFPLVVAADSMLPGASYTLQLTAQVGTLQGSSFSKTSSKGFADITVVVNAPPDSGILSVSPDTGVALNTTFTLRSVNWVDEDLPITHAFFSFVPESAEAAETALPVALSTLSNLRARGISARTVVNLLPEGREVTGYAVELYVTVFDALDATSQARSSVSVEPVAVDAAALSEFASASLDAALEAGDVDATMQVVNALASTLNSVNCSAAPVCADYNREDCSDVEHTCGECLDGYTGLAGSHNTECVDAATTNLKDTGDACSSDDQCIYGYCDSDGKCALPAKECPNNCSFHGLCEAEDMAGKPWPSGRQTCLTTSTQCRVECACDDGWYGLACSVNASDFELRRTTRESSVDGFANATALQLSTREVLNSQTSSALLLAQSRAELSDRAAVVAGSVLSNIVVSSVDLPPDRDGARALLQIASQLLPESSGRDEEGANVAQTRSHATDGVTALGVALREDMVVGESALERAEDNLRMRFEVKAGHTLSGSTVTPFFSDTELDSGAETSSFQLPRKCLVAKTDASSSAGVSVTQWERSIYPDATMRSTSVRLALVTGDADAATDVDEECEDARRRRRLQLEAKHTEDWPYRGLSSSVSANTYDPETEILVELTSLSGTSTGLSNATEEQHVVECACGDFGRKQVNCSDGTVIAVDCNGTVAEVNVTCPSNGTETSCQTGDGGALDSANCRLVEETSDHAVCACTTVPGVTQDGGSSRRRLFERFDPALVARHARAMQALPCHRLGGSAAGTGSAAACRRLRRQLRERHDDVQRRSRMLSSSAQEIADESGASDFVTVAEITTSSASTTVSQADSLSVNDLSTNWVILTVLGGVFVVFGVLGFGMWCVDTEESRDPTGHVDIVAKLRENPLADDMSKLIRNYILSALPPAVVHPSMWERWKLAMASDHAMLALFSRQSRLPRWCNALQALSVIVIIMFLDSVLYDVMVPPEDECDKYAEADTCSAETAVYDSSEKLCEWRLDSCACKFIGPELHPVTLLISVLLIALLAFPLEAVMETLVENYLVKHADSNSSETGVESSSPPSDEKTASQQSSQAEAGLVRRPRGRPSRVEDMRQRLSVHFQAEQSRSRLSNGAVNRSIVPLQQTDRTARSSFIQRRRSSMSASTVSTERSLTLQCIRELERYRQLLAADAEEVDFSQLDSFYAAKEANTDAMRVRDRVAFARRALPLFDAVWDVDPDTGTVNSGTALERRVGKDGMSMLANRVKAAVAVAKREYKSMKDMTEIERSRNLVQMFAGERLGTSERRVLYRTEVLDAPEIEYVAGWKKVVAWAVLIVMLLGMSFYVFLFAVLHGPAVTYAWLVEFGVALFLDVFVLEPLILLLVRALYPLVVLDDIMWTISELEVAEKAARGVGVNEVAVAVDDNDEEGSAGGGIPTASLPVFNANKYVMASHILASAFPQDTMSRVILAHCSPFPPEVAGDTAHGMRALWTPNLSLAARSRNAVRDERNSELRRRVLRGTGRAILVSLALAVLRLPTEIQEELFRLLLGSIVVAFAWIGAQLTSIPAAIAMCGVLVVGIGGPVAYLVYYHSRHAVDEQKNILHASTVRHRVMRVGRSGEDVDSDGGAISSDDDDAVHNFREVHVQAAGGFLANKEQGDTDYDHEDRDDSFAEEDGNEPVEKAALVRPTVSSVGRAAQARSRGLLSLSVGQPGKQSGLSRKRVSPSTESEPNSLTGSSSVALGGAPSPSDSAAHLEFAVARRESSHTVML